MPNRGYSASLSYRYGFNGKENDNEVKGAGNELDYGRRIYDSRLGRFLSVDPLQAKYPELTPFQFASNSPIANVDLDGLEQLYYSLVFDKGGKPALKYDGYQLRGPTYWQDMMGDLLGIDRSEWSGDILPFSYNLDYNGKNHQFFSAKDLVGYVNSIPINPNNAAREEEVKSMSEGAEALKWMIIGELYYQQDMADGHFDGGEGLPPSTNRTNKKTAEAHGGNTEAASSNTAGKEPTVVVSKSKGTFGGERAGKPFTGKVKKVESAENTTRNAGVERCENCKVNVQPAKKSQKGVTPPKNERRYDHIHPQSKNGDGSSSNIQVLCDGCNTKKSDKLPVTQNEH